MTHHYKEASCGATSAKLRQCFTTSIIFWFQMLSRKVLPSIYLLYSMNQIIIAKRKARIPVPPLQMRIFVTIHPFDEITKSWKPSKHKIGTKGNLTNAVKEAVFTQVAPLSLGDQFANRCTALLAPPCITTQLVTCSYYYHYWKFVFLKKLTLLMMQPFTLINIKEVCSMKMSLSAITRGV